MAENLSPNSAPAAKAPHALKRGAAQAELEQFDAVLEELDIEVESRVADMQSSASALIASLTLAFRTQLTKLPRRVRAMALADFVGPAYNGSVDAVMGAAARQAQSAFDTWVAQTPLPSTISGTARRMARKQGADATPASAAVAAPGGPADWAQAWGFEGSATESVVETPAAGKGRRKAAAASAVAAAATVVSEAPPMSSRRARAAGPGLAELPAESPRHSTRKAKASSSTAVAAVAVPLPENSLVVSMGADVAAMSAVQKAEQLLKLQAAKQQMEEWMKALEAPVAAAAPAPVASGAAPTARPPRRK